MKFFKKLFYLLKFYTMYSNQKREINESIDNYADLIVLNPGQQNVVIPKIIWMYWEGSLPEFVQKCVDNIKKNNPKTAATDKMMMVFELNQSSSCPFSRTYCNEPTASASKAIPSQSISEVRLFSAYLGLLTNCRVSKVAMIPLGILI